MAREYKVLYRSEDRFPLIYRVYNEPGLSWRNAKKEVRSWFLSQIKILRSQSEKEYISEMHTNPEESTDDTVSQ